MFWNKKEEMKPNSKATRRTSTPAVMSNTATTGNNLRNTTPATITTTTSYQYNNNLNNNGLNLNSNSVYKLYYFPIRNTVEASRMILHYSGVPFEDIRITPEEWPKWKTKMPQQALPVLLVEGKRLSQSTAIAAFLGHRFGLAGRTDWEQARVDEAVQTYKDFYEKVHDYMLIVGGFKQGNAKEVLKTTVEPAAEYYLPLFSHMIDRHNNAFIAGNRETYADFIISDFLFSLKGMLLKLFEKRNDLQQYISRVQSLPQLQQYLRNRPTTAF